MFLPRQISFRVGLEENLKRKLNAIELLMSPKNWLPVFLSSIAL